MFKKQLAAYSKITDDALGELFISNGVTPPHLQEVMAYSVMAGGKRLRPALVLATCALFGGDEAQALPFACAIELIHTYSLIHDDLPCIDNDDLRRGRPTSHMQYDERRALLAGDGLLSLAFETMLKAADNSNNKTRAIKATKAIADAAGTSGMVAGQWQDVLSEGCPISQRELEYIHRHKTAALLIGAIQAGGYIAGASEQDISLMTEYGRYIGLTFQISDDILDVVGDASLLGKNIGSDAMDKKVTYVSLYGLERAREIEAELTTLACGLVANMEKGAFFQELPRYIIERAN